MAGRELARIPDLLTSSQTLLQSFRLSLYSACCCLPGRAQGTAGRFGLPRLLLAGVGARLAHEGKEPQKAKHLGLRLRYSRISSEMFGVGAGGVCCSLLTSKHRDVNSDSRAAKFGLKPIRVPL